MLRSLENERDIPQWVKDQLDRGEGYFFERLGKIQIKGTERRKNG